MYEICFGALMLDEPDHSVGPRHAVVKGRVQIVRDQKLHHCNKGGPFVSLLKAVSLSYSGHQPHGQHDEIAFSVSERISRTTECAFQQPRIAKEMRFARNRDRRSIDLDDYL